MMAHVPIEIFSIENLALQLFGALAFLAGALDFMFLVIPRDWRIRGVVLKSIRRLDGLFSSFFRSAGSIPWFLSALLISILAPVYDMYSDASWADEVLRTGMPDMSWAELVRNSHTRTLPTLMHVGQTAILFFVLWLYSLMWQQILVFSSSRADLDIFRRGQRWTFVAGFIATIVAPASYLINYVGKHAEIALGLTMALTP